MTMTNSKSKKFYVLAIAPSTHTVGFAVLHDRHILADWGLKNIEGKKNASSLSVVERLIGTYEPDMLVFEDVRAKGARRSPRVQELLNQIAAMAKDRDLPVRTFGRQQVMDTIVPYGEQTKHTVAEVVAGKFSEQLSTQVPPKRKPWEGENYQMPMFQALALALTFVQKS